MQTEGLHGARRGKTFRTTRPDKTALRPPGLVNREFHATRPNEVWVVDFTYVATWSGMAFTAFVSDVYSRRIVGWRTAATMLTELPLDALEMALSTCARAGAPVDVVVHHSDAGTQGGFNWSSQHLDRGGVDGTSGRVDEEVDWAVTDEVAWRAGVATRGRARVLA
jgi:putative transposase